jgi:hypothetical protein
LIDAPEDRRAPAVASRAGLKTPSRRSTWSGVREREPVEWTRRSMGEVLAD